MLVLLVALPLRAEEVVAGLSQNRVSLTVNFEGSEILIFGAIRRDAPVPETGPLDVIITIEGPPQPVTVWRKARRAGIWVNAQSQQFRAAPSFYAIATTGPINDILSRDADLTYRISKELAIFEVRGADAQDRPAFTEALLRVRGQQDLYQLHENTVALERDTLFSTTLTLPKTIVEGQYAARIFLLREGTVLDVFETVIDVQKAIFERWLTMLAFEQPLLYGLLALGLAVFFGWGASALFRLFQG
ncbi:MAG: TIGR02186 family protein [Roseinatronobacter sp.]